MLIITYTDSRWHYRWDAICRPASELTRRRTIKTTETDNSHSTPVVMLSVALLDNVRTYLNAVVASRTNNFIAFWTTFWWRTAIGQEDTLKKLLWRPYISAEWIVQYPWIYPQYSLSLISTHGYIHGYIHGYPYPRQPWNLHWTQMFFFAYVQ